MTDSARDVKGQAKEKLGHAAGDEDLKREGQAEQAAEKVKGGIDKAAEGIKRALGSDDKR